MFVKHSMPLVKWFQNRQISFKTKCCIHFWPVNAKCDLAIAGTDLGLARHTSSQYGEHMRELISKQVDRFPTIWSRHKTLYSFRISIAKGNFDLAGMDLGPGHLTQYGEKRRKSVKYVIHLNLPYCLMPMYHQPAPCNCMTSAGRFTVCLNSSSISSNTPLTFTTSVTLRGKISAIMDAYSDKQCGHFHQFSDILYTIQCD